MSTLNTLKKVIEELPKYHHLEILKILKFHPNIPLNENNNGTFINLTELDSNIIKELEKYVQYVLQQQEQLAEVEKQKEILEKTFFTSTTESTTESTTADGNIDSTTADGNIDSNTDSNTTSVKDNKGLTA